LHAFLLAGDNPDLALLELKGALRAEVGRTDVELVHPRIAIVRGLKDEEAEIVVRRLARTHSCHRVEEEPQGPEDLGRPLATREKLADRKPHLRPVFRPDSTEPFLARTLVNVAAAPRGEPFLDPMCNVGGILIEAGLIGCRPVIGIDVREEMVRGARENLEAYGIRDHELHVAKAQDVESVLEGPVAACALDPPYGRASHSRPRDPVRLLMEVLDALTNVVEGRVALAVADDVWKEVGPSFDHGPVVEDRVHSSLTRVVTYLRG